MRKRRGGAEATAAKRGLRLRTNAPFEPVPKRIARQSGRTLRPHFWNSKQRQ
jgi:hypothetical protein